MRLKQARRSKKLLTFFRAAYGFCPPFQVLVDGTALQTSVNLNMNLEEGTEKLLGGKVRLSVPKAVVAELHALGKQFAVAAKAARRLRVLSGDGSRASEASSSILALVADHNPQRFVVCTEDPNLQKAISKLNGVPLIRFARERLVLVDCRGPDADADSAEAAAKQPTAGAKPTAKAGEGGVTGDSGATEGAAAASLESRKRKARRDKAPNPLSCKKKKKAPEQPKGQAATGAESRSKVRKRKRGGAKSGEAGSAGSDAAEPAAKNAAPRRGAHPT